MTFLNTGFMADTFAECVDYAKALYAQHFRGNNEETVKRLALAMFEWTLRHD